MAIISAKNLDKEIVLIFLFWNKEKGYFFGVLDGIGHDQFFDR